MAGKFVELKEAAQMIGVTPEELIEMRSRGDIFGYRDGASWKFKMEEVERVIGERGGASSSGSAILGANDEDFENLISGLSSKILAEKAQEEAESVLLSEEELGVSSTGQSTIIGKGKQPVETTGESDLKLADDSALGAAGSGLGMGSDKLLEAPGSRLNVGADASDVLHGSDIKLTSGSGTGDMPPAAGASGALDLGDKLSLGEDDDLELGSSDSAIDDDEIKPKRGSGKGSDVTLGAGDSGINLSPTDSGLSLEEEPLELVGSSVDSLELPEDDEIIALDHDAADPDQATQLKADQDFQLSPTGAPADDESDSGSQVIALEDSEAFDQDAATMLRSEPGGALAPEFQPVEAGLGPLPGMGGAMAPGPAQTVYVQVPTVEAPYSIWNVLSLMAIALLLSIGTMMMVDLMLNMWSFSGSSSITTGIMDSVISTFGMGNS